MPLHTRLCELLRIEHPIISAPMGGGTAGATLAAAVSEAGGLGMIGGTTVGADAPEWLSAQIRAVRERTDRPFGVGFISSFPGLEALIAVAIDERVPVLAHSFADPSPYIGAAHGAGCLVLVQVQTLEQARAAVQAGADAVAAQGTEAGGHTGYAGTLPFVPAVVDAAGGVPVVAAGGIADGRGLAAVLMLGAVGAWIGTRFVASREADEAEWAKERIVAAGPDDTVLTHAYDLALEAPFPAGIGDRVLRNDFTAAWHDRDAEVVTRRDDLARQVVAAIRAGDARTAAVRAGTASGLIHAVEPAGDILRRIVAEAETLLRTRPSQLLG
jgi:nitronate monooxygenase